MRDRGGVESAARRGREEEESISFGMDPKLLQAPYGCSVAASTGLGEGASPLTLRACVKEKRKSAEGPPTPEPLVIQKDWRLLSGAVYVVRIGLIRALRLGLAGVGSRTIRKLRCLSHLGMVAAKDVVTLLKEGVYKLLPDALPCAFGNSSGLHGFAPFIFPD